MLTKPPGVILRIILFSLSATYTLPEISTVKPYGPLKVAAIPCPSVLPDVIHDPAKVLTNPPGVILRILLPPVSATYTFPESSTAIPDGALNLAKMPCPSAMPEAVEPANVLTNPPAVIFRISLFPTSATYILPDLSTAIPDG